MFKKIKVEVSPDALAVSSVSTNIMLELKKSPNQDPKQSTPRTCHRKEVYR